MECEKSGTTRQHGDACLSPSGTRRVAHQVSHGSDNTIIKDAGAEFGLGAAEVPQGDSVWRRTENAQGLASLSSSANLANFDINRKGGWTVDREHDRYRCRRRFLISHGSDRPAGKCCAAESMAQDHDSTH